MGQRNKMNVIQKRSKIVSMPLGIEKFTEIIVIGKDKHIYFITSEITFGESNRTIGIYVTEVSIIDIYANLCEGSQPLCILSYEVDKIKKLQKEVYTLEEKYEIGSNENIPKDIYKSEFTKEIIYLINDARQCKLYS